MTQMGWPSEGPQNGGKTTGMDIPELRDINGPALMPKKWRNRSNRHMGVFI